MASNNRAQIRSWHRPALAQLPLCLALLAGGCTVSSSVPGSGGAPGTGGSGSGGASTPGTGGSEKGGAPGTGGSGSGGASSPGGTTGTGGTSKVGTGGSVGGTSGSAGSSGTTPNGNPVPSSGCGKTSTVKFGTVPGESGTSVGHGDGGYVTIQSGGQSRGFAMRLPANYDNNKPYWLIFGFHWNGGNSKEVDTGGSNGYQMAHFGLQKLSNDGAIFVAPDGLNAGWGGNNLPFVDDMVKLIEGDLCVDTSQLFALGFSYGGGMSYEIACARASSFRAVAVYSGAQLSGCDDGSKPIAYLGIHGVSDGTCGIGGGRSLRDKFVKNNGCTPQNPPQPPQPPPFLKTGGHVCTDYAGCSAGHPVRWCPYDGGHTPSPTDSGKRDSWVPAEVWAFLGQF